MGKKILIAEDEAFTRGVIEAALRRSGASVFAAADGVEAINRMSGNVEFDAVLLDLMMPAAHGLQVLKEIRTGRTPQRRNTPVGILTGASDKQSVSISMSLDADAFLLKPINRAMMVERLEHLVYRGNRIVKDAAQYEAIRVPPPDEMGAGSPPPPKMAQRDNPTALRLEAHELKSGMIVAEDLVTADGDVVVPSGVAISDVLLGVLSDLQRIVKLAPVAIQP